MKYKLLLYIILSSIFLSNCYALDYAPFDLILKIKNEKVLESTEISWSRKLYKNIFLIRIKPNITLQKVIENFKSNRDIIYMQKNYIHKLDKSLTLKKKISTSPKFFSRVKKLRRRANESPFNDPKAYKQWFLQKASDFGVDVDDVFLKGYSKKVRDVIVAVIDSGVEYTHSDLKNKMWINKNEIVGNGIDDDNNGYIDDIYGVNFYNRDKNGKATSNPFPRKSGHGTHVAGIIAAEQNNKIGGDGISVNAKIMALRILDKHVNEKDSDVIEAFIYAAKNGAKVINCSFGKHSQSIAVSDTIDYIGLQFDVLVVVSAGNNGKRLDNYPKYPASFSNANKITVGSLEFTGYPSGFSNYSKTKVDLFAPGGMILSTFLKNKYKTLSGTSMAAPMVTGVAAELRAYFPKLTAIEVKKILLQSVTKLKRLKNKCKSGGIVNLLAAIQAAKKLEFK